MTVNTWQECIIQKEGILTGELFRFKDLCVPAFKAGGFPKDAAVFSEAVFEDDQVKFWVSPAAADLLEKSGIDLKKWQAKPASPPQASGVSLLVGNYKFAWDLLTQ